MKRWFVHFEIDYYPWAEVVESDTRVGAQIKALERVTLGGEVQGAVAVVPLDQVSFAGTDWRIAQLQESDTP